MMDRRIRLAGQIVLTLWVGFVAFAMAYQWYLAVPFSVPTILLCVALVAGPIGLADKFGIIDLDARD